MTSHAMADECGKTIVFDASNGVDAALRLKDTPITVVGGECLIKCRAIRRPDGSGRGVCMYDLVVSRGYSPKPSYTSQVCGR